MHAAGRGDITGQPSTTCSRAVDALRSVRRPAPMIQVQRELNNDKTLVLIQRAKAKGKDCVQPWTVRIFCLSDTTDVKVPCSASTKILLLGAGLGEQTVTVPNVNCTMKEFREIILGTYPKLKDGGGFDMLRCLPNSRDLAIVTGKVTQSPKILKTVLGSGRLYLRPIQTNLDISTAEDQEWV